MLFLKGVGVEFQIDCSVEGLIVIKTARKEKDGTRRRAWVLLYNHWTYLVHWHHDHHIPKQVRQRSYD